MKQKEKVVYVTTKIVIRKWPYSLEDFVELIKMFNDINGDSMEIEVIKIKEDHD